MKRLTISLLAATLTVTLTSCGSGDTDNTATASSEATAPHTVVTTVTETAESPSPKSIPSTAPQPAVTSTPAPVSTSDEIYEQLKTNPSIGAPITINGQQSTVCVYGDGYGLNLVAAGQNTSCEFARAVMDAQIEEIKAEMANVRDHLKSPIDVMSPVTGERYTMQCSTAPSKLITCTGGNNATVYMY
ncbi:hypothetical protein CKALI_04890 [Corynebacterium kalinowskii]|uniref:Secreted protein n=1 Tax=Corynebacterium kalinowskii TaxID=2675216 RepID=A0A6B8VK53_9CORY|nr:hypothetical protein [Corynebacterium kalinowskii]QGU01854.1 hypothetical protein CKALI_04890 [Corynebacterium kalinowskii]